MPQDAPRNASEDDRVAFLQDLAIDGPIPEAAFDKIVALAADLFDVPMAAVTLIGASRQWLKAKVGLDIAETPRCESFCTHTIASREVMVVTDAARDSRFRDTPLVIEAGVRFYAGAPLRAESGVQIGAFCIMDTSPRAPLSGREERLLAEFSAIAMAEIENRRSRRANAILRGLADSTGASLVCTRADGRITYINPSAERLLGYAACDLVGRDVVEIIPQRFVATHRGGMARVAAGAPSKLSGKTFETILRRKDGGEIPIDLGLTVWHDASGLNVGATIRDISERKRKEERLNRLANYDPLTGLARAHGFQGELVAVLEGSGLAAVLFLEIEGLRTVNDDLGHSIGDALLQAIAIRLLAVVPHGVKLARWSGDVFAVLLSHAHDPIKIRECAQDIEMALAEPFAIDDHTIVVGATFGAALAPDHAETAPDLIAAADLALHRAKSDPGSRFRLFERSMQTETAARRALRNEVRQGFDANQFVMFYQPQVALETGGIVGAEALMRWRHPLRGLLAPGVFIAAMEDSALALRAGRWTLDQAGRQIAAWRAERRPPLRVSVNLFAAQLRHGGLVTTVRDLLAKYDIPNGQMELEVRETIAHQDDDTVIAVLRELRALGVGIALDDFGTGYASLRTLKQLPVSTIKIDQSFVRDIGAAGDKHDSAIVAAILDVGRRLGLDVVAEGIETPGQAATLQRMGCPTGQGYHYGRPVASGLFTSWPAFALNEPLPKSRKLLPRRR